MSDSSRRSPFSLQGIVDLGSSVRSTVGRRLAEISAEERRRLRAFVFALAAVAVAALMRLLLGLEATPFLFFYVAVAVSAWNGGIWPGVVAALAALLAERVNSNIPAGSSNDWVTGIAFVAESLAITLVVGRLAASVEQTEDRLWAADSRISELESHDRDLRRELADFTTSMAKAETALRQEADIAREQLETLQSVTDPSLNALAGTELVVALLDRLRLVLDADGVAVMRVGAFRSRVMTARAGLQPTTGARKTLAEVRQHPTGRTLLIHNDADQLEQVSVFAWPEGATSLIAVPVVRSGQTRAVLEVVKCQPGRSTEWEIALAQVVAERTAGLMRDDEYADAGAVA